MVHQSNTRLAVNINVTSAADVSIFQFVRIKLREYAKHNDEAQRD